MQKPNADELHGSIIEHGLVECAIAAYFPKNIWCKLVSSSGDLWHQQASERVGREKEEPGEDEAAGAGEAEGGAETAGEGAGGAEEGGGEVRLKIKV